MKALLLKQQSRIEIARRVKAVMEYMGPMAALGKTALCNELGDMAQRGDRFAEACLLYIAGNKKRARVVMATQGGSK